MPQNNRDTHIDINRAGAQLPQNNNWNNIADNVFYTLLCFLICTWLILPIFIAIFRPTINYFVAQLIYLLTPDNDLVTKLRT
jgi:hypothetical protein